MSNKAKVIYLHQLDPQAALERLNRLTGLQFTRWPQSLKPAVQDEWVAPRLAEVAASAEGLAAAAEPLSYVARDALALL